MLPLVTVKSVKELNAFAPRTVEVVISDMVPFTVTVVSVRISGLMVLANKNPGEAPRAVATAILMDLRENTDAGEDPRAA